MISRTPTLLLLALCILCDYSAQSFNLVLMGARRGKGGLKQNLEDKAGKKKKGAASLNQGKGQEITGVTLPAEGNIKGWEFGNDVRLACANVNGKFYGLQVRAVLFFRRSYSCCW